MPAVHAQHQGVARQIQQLLGREHARAAPGRPHHGQTRAVRLGERNLLGARQGFAHLGHQNALQAVGAQHIAHHMAVLRQRHADLHGLRAQALAQQLEAAGGIRWPVDASGLGTGQCLARMQLGQMAFVLDQQGAVRRLGMLDETHVFTAPFDAHQIAALLQQLGRMLAPGGMLAAVGAQRQQVLQIAAQRCTDIADRIGGVALQLFLHLRGLIASGQPDHGDQHADHQCHQQGP